MPTILELFQGSSNNITPSPSEFFPVQKKFKGSTQEKSVKSNTETLIEEETKGIRVKTAVELNNPRLYGNESVRIMNRTTKSVEDMKGSTGGTSATGGIIGKGLGALTGGKITSISGVRDFVNTKLGIPSNAIPTYVNKTGELQKGKEQDTMITLAKIKNDAKGTLLGQLLKQSGGGTPATIGKQILGKGISLGKEKLRGFLFGQPTQMGTNNSKPANGGWDYSSQSNYSTQIREARAQNEAPTVEGVDKAKSDALKKANDIKQKGQEKLGNLIGSAKDKLKGTSKQTVAPAIDQAVESQTQTKTTPTSELPYTKTLDGYKNEGGDEKLTRIDLSLVSPIYGVDRKSTSGKYGTSEYAFQDVKNNTGVYSPYNPDSSYSSTKKNNLETYHGIKNGSDMINRSSKSTKEANDYLNDRDLIPFWIRSKSTGDTMHFRSIITGLSETVSPSWSTNKFFGNPFNFYTFDSVERSVSFTLTTYCLNPDELSKMWTKIEFLTDIAYPSINSLKTKQRFVTPPIIDFRLGDMYDAKIGFIESLTYNIPDNSTWETVADGALLPKIVEINIGIKFIETADSSATKYSIERSKDQIKLINDRRSKQGGAFQTDSISTDENTKPLPKLNAKGIEQTEAPKEGGINKPQTDLKTNTPTPTPAASESPTVAPTQPVTKLDEIQAKNLEKLKSKGIPEVFHYGFSQIDVNVDSIKKIRDGVYYYETTYHDVVSRMVAEQTANGYDSSNIDIWIPRYNKGVNPFASNPNEGSSTGKLQTALPF
jgi:hypothetical protein